MVGLVVIELTIHHGADSGIGINEGLVSARGEIHNGETYVAKRCNFLFRFPGSHYERGLVDLHTCLVVLTHPDTSCIWTSVLDAIQTFGQLLDGGSIDGVLWKALGAFEIDQG